MFSYTKRAGWNGRRTDEGVWELCDADLRDQPLTRGAKD